MHQWRDTWGSSSPRGSPPPYPGLSRPQTSTSNRSVTTGLSLEIDSLSAPSFPGFQLPAETVFQHITKSSSPGIESLPATSIPAAASLPRPSTSTSRGLTSAKSSSSNPEPIPNLPVPGNPEPSIDALFQSVNTFALAHGFAVIKRNGHKYKGRLVRYNFQCDRFGASRAGPSANLRQRRSRKCGCKWQVIAEAKEEGKWLLRAHPNADHHSHNHPPSINPSAHPVHRRATDSVKATIRTTSQRVAIRARDVRAVVAEKHPDTVLTQKDIYNARSAIAREKLDGLNPTAALIKLFDEQGVIYKVKWADDEPNRLVGLVWTFPSCIRLWKRFPEIVSLDNTYNTNRFKLPLFQVTGQTCLNTVFNAAFGLIDNERLEGFQFLAESVLALMTEECIRLPDVVITDFDTQMKSALNQYFPDAQQQLCIQHINSNVLLQAKKKWKHPSFSNKASDIDTDEAEDIELDSEDRDAVRATQDQNTGGQGAIPHNYRGTLDI